MKLLELAGQVTRLGASLARVMGRPSVKSSYEHVNEQIDGEGIFLGCGPLVMEMKVVKIGIYPRSLDSPFHSREMDVSVLQAGGVVVAMRIDGMRREKKRKDKKGGRGLRVKL